MKSIEKLQEKVIDIFDNLVIAGKPYELYEPIVYTMSLGGKRIRPLLLLQACEMFGGKMKNAVNPAVGIELFHNFTLLHDDIMDRADKLGLAQLHQLRGRVGRGAAASTCVLLFSEPLSELAKARLKVIYEHTDGFEIARQDLQIRGPGEFLGARQSGAPMLRFARLEEDMLLLEQARGVAPRLMEEQPEVVEAHLARWLGSREGFLGV